MRDLVSIIGRLKAANEGSQQLDAEIDAALRIGRPNLPAWAWENFPEWQPRSDGRVEVKHEGVHWAPHPFTSSLDASLPGEVIRYSLLLGDDRYEAEARDGAENYHLAEAATEPLARRAAALKAIHDDRTRQTRAHYEALAEEAEKGGGEA